MTRKQKIRLTIAVTATSSIVLYAVLTKAPEKPNQPAQSSVSHFQSAPKTFHGYSPSGTGGDPSLNILKNRWTPPDTVYDITISQILSFAHLQIDAAGKKYRNHWPTQATAEVAQAERLGVRVEGYLLAIKRSGTESCNGKDDSLRDYHIWIGESPNDTKPRGLIVEMTPYYLEQHPEWGLHSIQALTQRHSKVRVSGWIFWDEEHPDEVDKSRLTQWEVHPVTNFEFYDNNSWRQLPAEIAQR